ncbi:MAG TPA: rod shape-determining protein MreD [Pyrinomonadaceae bacterium]
MRQLKIAIVLALAIILQSSLRLVWHPFVYVDLPLIVVVYFALQRDPLQALVVGMIAGLGTDVLSGGLLGASGFTKTIIAYLISAIANRVMLDNPLMRIPVLASAALLDAALYVLLHRMLGQPSLIPFVQMAGFKVIATTIAGTLLLYVLDQFFSERARQKRQFAFRRKVARRTLRRR